jgi:hypothetical protein
MEEYEGVRISSLVGMGLYELTYLRDTVYVSVMFAEHTEMMETRVGIQMGVHTIIVASSLYTLYRSWGPYFSLVRARMEIFRRLVIYSSDPLV